MNGSPNSADILLKNVIDYHDRPLVRMNHQSAYGFILLDETEIIEIIGWISDPLEQVSGSEGVEVADLEEDLPKLSFKLRKLDRLWTQIIIIRALIFLQHVVLDVRHVLLELAALDLNGAGERVDVEHVAAMIVLIKLTIEEVTHTTFLICVISRLLVQV